MPDFFIFFNWLTQRFTICSNGVEVTVECKRVEKIVKIITILK